MYKFFNINKCILYEILLSYLNIDLFDINIISNKSWKQERRFNMERNKTLSHARNKRNICRSSVLKYIGRQ